MEISSRQKFIRFCLGLTASAYKTWTVFTDERQRVGAGNRELTDERYRVGARIVSFSGVVRPGLGRSGALVEIALALPQPYQLLQT